MKSIAIRSIFFILLSLPLQVLGLTLVGDNAFLVTAVIFVPMIAAWYQALSISEWYESRINLNRLTNYLQICAVVVPGFADRLEAATRKVTNQYLERFTTDPAFRDSELKAIIKEDDE